MKRGTTGIVTLIFTAGYALGVISGWLATLFHRAYILKLIGQ